MDLDLSKRELLEWELWTLVHDAREPHQHWMYKVLCHYFHIYKRETKVNAGWTETINELNSK